MKIISYSLWGEDPKYTIGAVRNAETIKDFYPGWIGRFYCGQSVPSEIIKRIESNPECEVILMNEQGNWEGMFWRFFAADSDDVVLSRDTDCRFSEREVNAVNDWLNGDKDFHVMRDHPYHGTEILGGMWGSRNGILRGIIEWITEYKKGDFWQVDQNFLREVVWPKVQNNTCTHDEFFAKIPFPSPRKPREFVGKAFNGDDTEFEPRHGEMV